MTGNSNAIVEANQRAAAAERRVLATVQRLTPQRQYSKRSLALMSIGRGALVVSDGLKLAEAKRNGA
jgi:hypothetical protein